jgi:DNA replication protein DnaC
VADLLDFLRQALHGEANQDYYLIKQTVRNCALLLLDDLEMGMGSDWVRNELFQLLNPRYLARLPTVITTPETTNRLLTDKGGWERLARIVIGDANFCSVVPIGELTNRPEEDDSSKSPRSPGKSKGGGKKSA